MCFTVQLSRFLSVFDSFDILSYHFVFVKNFFQKVFLQCVEKPFSTACNFLLFVVIFATAILDYHIFSDLSITFLTFFHNIWKFHFHIIKICYQSFPYRISCNLFTISQVPLIVNNFFHNILNCVNFFEIL